MISCTSNDIKSAFIIPYTEHANDENAKKFLVDAIQGLFSQTDKNWYAIIIANKLCKRETFDYMSDTMQKFFPRINVIFLTENLGPGLSRNLGVHKALELGCSIVLFNDADDISHPRRLEIVKNIFFENPSTDVIYSSFEVIDENNNAVSSEKISTPILEVMESCEQNTLEGKNVWIKMGTETGYVNITSATAVRIKLALKCPFPDELASEDFHCWMRMSALGADFRFSPLIPTKYRIQSSMKYQASRMRIGPSLFNQIKARVDCDGFFEAIEIALRENSIKPKSIPLLKEKFFQRLAKSMNREMEYELVATLLEKARQEKLTFNV